MAIAQATLTIADGGLSSSRSIPRPPAVIGTSSAGTVLTPTVIYTTEDLASAFGYGPLCEAVATLLKHGGAPVVACKATSATVSSSTAVSKVGTGTSVMTVSDGTGFDAYAVKVLITRAGASLAAATAAMQISLDDGTTYGQETAIPVSGVYAIPNTGLEVTFAAGTFVATDTYSFSCTAPLWDNAGLVLALAALEATALDHEFVLVEGPSVAADAIVLDTSMDTLAAAGVFRWGLCHARDNGGGESNSTWVGVLVGASPGFVAFTSTNVLVAAGYCTQASAVFSATWRRSVARVLAARLAALQTATGGGRVGLAEHPGRVLSGPIEGCVDAGLAHDLRVLSSLDTARFIGLQTIQGRTGYYATDRTAAAAGSDYTSVMNVRVVTEAARVGLSALQDYLNENFRTITGGVIDPRDADAADAHLTAILAASIVGNGYASSVSAAVNRTDNIVSTHRIRAKLRVRPLGYATEIVAEIGLTVE